MLPQNNYNSNIEGYAEWSKSEKQIPYTNAYIWNLEKWFWWTYLQGRNGDVNIENRLMDSSIGGKRSWDEWTE